MSVLKLPVNSRDHHLGNINAAITLVEYGDFECPHCRLAHPFVKKLLEDKSDSLHFVFRNFPLRKIHRHAHIAAVTAEAAGKQGKFWEMHDLIFENQPKLTTRLLLSLVERLGLNPEQFANDSNSDEILNKIETDFESDIRSGVNRTPTFLLNGSPILTYDETYESLLDAIQGESHNKAVERI